MTTLPETKIAHENPPFWWCLHGKIGVFMGYVSFREGKHYDPLDKDVFSGLISWAERRGIWGLPLNSHDFPGLTPWSKYMANRPQKVG